MPYIKESSILKVQDAADIIRVAESYGLKLKRVGSNFSALCPFHKEKTPSFSLNPQRQIFKCFGCGAAGGVVKFVQLMERCEYPEAIQQLAQRFGVVLEYEATSKNPHAVIIPAVKSAGRQPLLWANKTALKYFRRALADEVEGAAAKNYLLGRGFTAATIAAWSLGWSPNSWDGLVKFCEAEILQNGDESKLAKMREVGVAAGIFRKKADSDYLYDAFRGRVMFPIFDLQHRPIGFGGRVLVESAEAGGKYLNTAETPLFQKRALLFGLNFAAAEIGHTRTAIVVEGYTDTIMCHQYDVRNVVATLGTALTAEHVKLLRRYVGTEGKVIALFDADNAGRRATERAIEIFMEEDVNLFILQDLAVKDAGEFLPKFGGDKFREFLRTAQDSFSYALNNALGKNFGNDLAAKAAAVMKIMTLVNLCPNAIRRNLMRARVAETAKVDIDLLPQPTPAAERQTRPAYNRDNHDNNATQENYVAAPFIVNLEPERKRQRLSEQLLLRYLAVNKNWGARILDLYPLDDWHFDDLHRTASLLRTAWDAPTASEKTPPDLNLLITQTIDEEIRATLIDLLDAGKLPQLSDDELTQILQRLAQTELRQRKKILQVRLATAELGGDDTVVSDLLTELQAIDQKLH